jgi:type II secretory pathway predicted ATPase ExeA
MYYAHFGLKQPPFRITPDTSLFFPGANRGAVLDALVYAIQSGEGIVKVVGEVGSGKTMLCRMLEKELPADRIEIVYLANPRLPADQVLHAIAFELKLDIRENTPRLEVLNRLQQHLLECHARNRQVVVFVEEAQGMPIETLEEIRLLSNLETRHNKLLQIVLFGQPELDERIARPEIRQLRERITYSFELTPFHTNDIREYLNSRLRACGWRRGELFDEAAVRRIDRYSRGLVRRINILADKALLAAYAENRTNVTAADVERAARDSEFMNNARRVLGWPAAAAAAAIVVLAAAAWWWQSRPVVPVTAPVATGPAAVAPATGPAAVSTESRQSAAPEDAAAEAGVAEEAAAEPTPPSGPDARQPGAEGEALLITNVSDSVSATIGPAEGGTGAAAEAPAGDLLDLDALLKEAGDDEARMRRQLEAQPPEGLMLGALSPEGDACSVCWAIVYRPLYDEGRL